ncbi:hypothetical protein TOPH_01956 [Tolypocladium ophioglossoides CBS 100239]|uniref:Uncharacterized protein n=1 Tax=Tolypocladium ophioglossoides (strain CBS 100239) TaxID=1163406 RepID=A0A0L0NHA3_TOLOC|nr:hypothetical protein TOPH_01956 [Tolypocladium ophioglossoides CBS 100239]
MTSSSSPLPCTAKRVFGSIAKGISHEYSDVDVADITAAEDPPLPLGALFLEDVLPKTFARPVDLLYIKQGAMELRGYIQLEALLTSRTIYLRDHQDFMKWPVEQHQSIILQIQTLLNAFDIQPQSHPMHEAFWLVVLDAASNVRERLEAMGMTMLTEQGESRARPSEGLLQAIWQVLTSSEKDGIDFLERGTRKFVVPALDETRELGSRTEDIFQYRGCS